MDYKIKKRICGILLIVSGWLALGIGFTIRSSYNGLIFYSGFVLMFLGIVVLVVKKKQKKKKNKGHGLSA